MHVSAILFFVFRLIDRLIDRFGQNHSWLFALAEAIVWESFLVFLVFFFFFFFFFFFCFLSSSFLCFWSPIPGYFSDSGCCWWVFCCWFVIFVAVVLVLLVVSVFFVSVEYLPLRHPYYFFCFWFIHHVTFLALRHLISETLITFLCIWRVVLWLVWLIFLLFVTCWYCQYSCAYACFLIIVLAFNPRWHIAITKLKNSPNETMKISRMST